MCCDCLTLYSIAKQTSPSFLDWLPTAFSKVDDVVLILSMSSSMKMKETLSSSTFSVRPVTLCGWPKLNHDHMLINIIKSRHSNVNKVVSQYLPLLFRGIKQSLSRDVKATAKQWHYHKSENYVNSMSASLSVLQIRMSALEPALHAHVTML